MLRRSTADPVEGSVLRRRCFRLWGAAHWFAAREGAAGHRAAHWVLALIGWGLVYPFLPGVLDAFWLSWANVCCRCS